MKAWETPEVINTHKAPTYAIAISELKAEGKCPQDTVHRQMKYLNNVIGADHGKLKQLIRPVRGFKTLKTAYGTIMGFAVMRVLRKGRAALFNLTHDIRGEGWVSKHLCSPISRLASPKSLQQRPYSLLCFTGSAGSALWP